MIALTVFLSGCIKAEINVNPEVQHEYPGINEDYSEAKDEPKGEEFRSYFEEYLPEKKESIQYIGTEAYIKDYWLLTADFMSGGFTTRNNLDYINNDYPQEYYQYCLEDLNDDGIPEFLLGYGYNGEDPYEWEIYKTGKNYKECFVGAAMRFDRERKAVFSDYGSELRSFTFDGEKLVPKDDYYLEYVECCDGDDPAEAKPPVYYYENEDHKVKTLSEKKYHSGIASYTEKEDTDFKGKRLGIENLAEDLGIGTDAWAKEWALRSYLAYMNFCIKNRDEMRYYRYSLSDMDGDGIPEMTAYGGQKYEFWFVSEGRVLREEGYENEDGDAQYTSCFPGKNIIRSYHADWGNVQEEYYAFRNGMLECILITRKEALESYLTNEFMKDFQGNILYNYCVNDELVSEKEYEEIRKTLYDVFDLEEEVKLKNMDNLFFDEMMTYIEKSLSD